MTTNEITEIINQFIFYFQNRDPHIVYGIPSENFLKEFNVNIDYRKEFANWYGKTEFYDKENAVEEILNKKRDYLPKFNNSKNSMEFFIRNPNLQTTWGYGKYFDGESIEFTAESEKIILNFSNILSNVIGKEVLIKGDVDCDYEDDMNLIIVIKI